MNFSKNFPGDDIKGYLKSNNFPYDGEIKVSKKIRSLRQLTRIEKELVKLVFKEASVKCLTFDDTQKYIAFKINIWIENSCLEFLKNLKSKKTGNGITDWPKTRRVSS